MHIKKTGSRGLCFRDFYLLGMLVLNLGFAGSADAIDLIPSRLAYGAHIERGLSLNGTAIRQLKQTPDGQWVYSFDIDSFIADIRESSVMDWDGKQLIPHRYHYSLSGMLVPDKEINIHFDWKKLQAHNPSKRKPWTLNIDPGAQDRISYQLQLRMDLLQGKTVMHYKVPYKAKVREYTFRIEGEDIIDTDLGQVATTIVKKVRAKNAKRVTTLWFARDWNYVLVKMIQIEKDGERYEINLKGGIVGDLKIQGEGRD